MPKVKNEYFVGLPCWLERIPQQQGSQQQNAEPQIAVFYQDGRKFVKVITEFDGSELQGLEDLGIAGGKVDPRRIVAGIIRTTEEMKAAEQIERAKRKAEKERKRAERGEKRFNKWWLVPITAAILAAGILAYESTIDNQEPFPTPSPGVHEEYSREEVDFTYSFSRVYYDVDNPSLDLSANAGMMGQEKMTNQYIWKEILAYNQDDHAEVERQSVSGFEWFEQVKSQIDVNFGILGNPQATQEQKLAAIDNLIALSQQIETYYSQNLGLMEQTRKRFQNSY